MDARTRTNKLGDENVLELRNKKCHTTAMENSS